MLKLPEKKYEPKHNNDLYDYAKGWNSTIAYTKYLCNEYNDAYAKEHLLKAKEALYEKVILSYYEGQYNCIIEIERLNEEDELIAKYSLYDMFSYSLAVLDRLNIRGE